MKHLNTKKLYIYHLICLFLPVSRCNSLKSALLRWCGASVGNHVEIMSTAKFYGGFELRIGDGVFIGYDAMIFGHNKSSIIIEDYAKVGSRACVVTGSHKFTTSSPSIAGEGVFADIKICKGAAIDTNALICPGKIVGEMAHVAAGSIVTHDVPPFTRVAGIPARVIKSFKKDNNIK